MGPDTGSLTISGGNSVGVFSVASGVQATFTGLTISGGFATNGGAIDNSGYTTVVNDTFTGNMAANGAAIANEASGTLNVLDSTFTADIGTGNGGAIANLGGTATVTNSTIANESAATGAGIYNAGNLTLINATIAYNNATQSGGGGGLDAASGTATLYNSIVAQNTAGTTPNVAADDISGTVSPGSSNNVIDDITSGGLVNSTDGNIIGMPAGLAAGLASNGGSTQTIALLTSSPALSAGAAAIPGVTVPKTDQRGAVRNPNDLNNGTTIDAGAFEISSSYLVTSTGDSVVAGTLRSAVAWANNNPAPTPASFPSTIVFDPTVFGTPQTINLSDSLGTLTFTNINSPVTIQGPGAALVTIAGDGTFGLISIPTGLTATLSGLTLDGGGAQSGGGIFNQGTLTISNSVLSNDSAVYYGGGIDNDGGSVTVSFTTFSNDTATYGLGGGIDNSGTLVVANSTFTGGDAFEGVRSTTRSPRSPAITTLTVTTSTFNVNTATQGGSIFNDASATIAGSTFSNNVAFQGGAIANDLAGTMMMTNSTVADNTAGQNGGGINQVGIFTALNVTIAYNSVANGGAGGGIDASAGTTTLYNTIVAGNTSAPAPSTTGTSTSSTGTSTSSTGTGTSSTGTTTAAIASDILGAIAPLSSNNLIGGLAADMLGPFANNGGPNETVALLAGSPAIDAAAASFTLAPGLSLAAPTLDQRARCAGPRA